MAPRRALPDSWSKILFHRPQSGVCIKEVAAAASSSVVKGMDESNDATVTMADEDGLENGIHNANDCSESSGYKTAVASSMAND